jgi:hypothetical protein
MGGIGTSPLGTGPYGYGQPPAIPSQAGPIFRDAARGLVGSCRQIDPGTRQYVIDADGRVAGGQTVPQLVYLAYATVKGSAILSDMGESFSDVKIIGDDFDAQMTALAKAPVQALIDQGLLEIVAITIDRIGSCGASIQVRWRDLTTGLEDSTTL